MKRFCTILALAVAASTLVAAQPAPKAQTESKAKSGCPELTGHGTLAKLSETDARNIVRVQQRPVADIRGLKAEQKVPVRIFVSEEGRVVCAELQSPGTADKELEQKTLEAAKDFAFVPYKAGSRTLPFESTLTFTFKPIVPSR